MAFFTDRQAPQSGIANLLAMKGRMGDTELVHMSKPEINVMRTMGQLTTNPFTGLPEAFNLEAAMQGLSGLMMPETTGREAMQQLINFGRNKIADYNAEDDNEPTMPTEGMQGVDGNGGDGMSDDILFKVKGDPKIDKALLSRDEYVLPADVVSKLGNGSSDAGAEKLDKFMGDVREASTGQRKQIKQIDGDKILRELV